MMCILHRFLLKTIEQTCFFSLIFFIFSNCYCHTVDDMICYMSSLCTTYMCSLTYMIFLLYIHISDPNMSNILQWIANWCITHPNWATYIKKNIHTYHKGRNPLYHTRGWGTSWKRAIIYDQTTLKGFRLHIL